MTSSPNYTKLMELGKLPQEHRNKVPMLGQIDKLEVRLEEVKSMLCADCLEKIFDEKIDPNADKAFESVCGHEDCKPAFVATGKTKLVADKRLKAHVRMVHEKKAE